MVSEPVFANSNTDDSVDAIIGQCLAPEAPKSFFLYAGAGSGKTYSLVKALETFEVLHGSRFRKSRKKIAVITYTNAACDEIVERVKGDPLFHISTIHSFCWLQIQSFHDDIRAWLSASLPDEIAELQRLEEKGKAGTQASITRQRSIANKQERLDWLKQKREFTYSPNGDNIGKASLSHVEVLKICADFVGSRPSFQQIVINRYPFILIDESQDTNKGLIEAFFKLEEAHHNTFSLGLIGDMMQRIYGDGKNDLGLGLPERWAKPVKLMNRRSPSRIIALANDIRSETDGQQQKVLDGKPDGLVRMFIAPSNKLDKPAFEDAVREKMSEMTGDTLWRDRDLVKHLMLEHMMAAARMGFSDMFAALSSSKRLTTALRSGDIPAVRLFSKQVLPLYQLQTSNSGSAVMNHLRRAKSPLLDKKALRSATDSEKNLHKLKVAIQDIQELVESDSTVSFLEILRCVAEHNLFSIPQSLIPFVDKAAAIEDDDVTEAPDETNEKVTTLDALQAFLETPFDQISAYDVYVSGLGPFDTHQGVKGLEFDRVLVVMDDGAAGGFLFSYEKLFDVKPPTKGDLDNQSKGVETGIDRTRRLFYVTCTRAEQSLALVAYSDDPKALKDSVLGKGWFHDHEVEIAI
jgi:DNA helicase-2/ATP-dependent DNA helicase PcrA